MTAKFSLVLDSQCALGQSPVWWAAASVLVFIDITGRRLHGFDPQSGRHEVDGVAEDMGCVAPTRGGRG
jgi:sugar lactone lactonase YvrE